MVGRAMTITGARFHVGGHSFIVGFTMSVTATFTAAFSGTPRGQRER